MLRCHNWIWSLPAEPWAVTTLLADGVGGIESLHHSGVLLAVGDGADDFMHLVPELGSRQVVTPHLWGLAHGSAECLLKITWKFSVTPPGEAVELVLLAVGVEEEAHAAGEVGRSVAGGAGQAGPPGHSTLQHRVGDHCDLEDNQNDDSWEIYSHVVRSSVISPVRLKDRTWLLEVALARTCMAVWRRGTLLSFAETTAAIADSREIVNTLALNIWHEMVRIRLWTISLDINKFTEFWYEQKISHWNWVITL